jgi:hypothetical protein
MKIEVENGRLIISKNIYSNMMFKDGYRVQYAEILNVDAKELAKALKPYLDSIDNCSFKKDDGLDGVNI